MDRRLNLILLILISIQLPVYPALSSTIIKSCYDGDTCTAMNGEKIRLACIDTPELKGKNANKIPAEKARDFLNQLVANKKVSIKRITKDRQVQSNNKTRDYSGFQAADYKGCMNKQNR